MGISVILTWYINTIWDVGDHMDWSAHVQSYVDPVLLYYVTGRASMSSFRYDEASVTEDIWRGELQCSTILISGPCESLMSVEILSQYSP